MFPPFVFTTAGIFAPIDHGGRLDSPIIKSAGTAYTLSKFTRRLDNANVMLVDSFIKL